MADVHTVEIRSYNMSRIKSKNTKPEILVRGFLHKAGYRFRLHKKDLPGKPDIVLPKHKAVVLVHGCFWHGHKSCKYYRLPKTRTDWWELKVKNNILRDKKNSAELEKAGWKLITIWECELKPKVRQVTLENLLSQLVDNAEIKADQDKTKNG